MILSSKVYLSYIRSYGTPSSLTLDWLSKIPRKNIPILTSDISLINERIFKERTKKNLSHDGIWCEEDGCVFRTVFCPFCTACETCFGVQVLATDASNANLLNKVLFYADCLCVNDESKSFNEVYLLTESEIVVMWVAPLSKSLRGWPHQECSFANIFLWLFWRCLRCLWQWIWFQWIGIGLSL
ncbi:hypothetical protein KSP40_PGU015115 [Platanthera guangdongensis]|uniref:Uncharacterized protein n=1 Tax=Platanthera guangdongensis TaxID=2320717 RepID=A0ABR2MXV6_9ASPA